jgi:ubiquinone biosynthesis protein
VTRLRIAARLLQIQRALVRHGLDDFVRATHLYRPFRFLFYLSPWTWFQRSDGESRGERLRLALEELGPIFVKFGQAVSTRRDLIPADIAVAAIERALGRPLTEVVASFEETPLAAASIAQVHAARLKSGEEVVVKVLRPGMHEIIERDLEVLQALAGLADEYWSDARRLRPLELVAEYRKTIIDELDLMREAGNAAQLKRNFAGSPLLYVPAVYWDHCRSNVMVMERIHGVVISRIEELKARGTNIAKLAENGVEIFFTQVFRHNFFHADMHPGNIFVQIDDPENPRYAAIDFGIVGTLQPRDQHYLAANFLAFFDHDYARVAALHVESGWVPKNARVDELESAVRTVCEPIFNKPLKEISFAQVLLRLFETARRFDMQIQPQLILLQKTLLNVEGLGRQLYPELDLWKTAQPVLREWMRERMSPRTVLKRLRAQLPDTIEGLKELPVLFQTAVREASEGRFRLQVENPGLAELRRELRQSNRRRDLAIAAAALWLSGSVWLAAAAPCRWFAWVQLAAAAISLAWYRSMKWQTK